MRLAVLVALAAVAAPAFAQSNLQLPDRPIRRAEIVAGLKRQFAAMDINKDGTISPTEFAAFRAKNGASSDPFARVGSHWFERTDADGNGKVTPAEAAARPLKMFDMADLNRDGTIGPDERRMAEMVMALGK